MPATFDCFGGLLTFNNGGAGPTGPGGPNQQTATCSQAGTTVTCTVTDGTKYKINEPMFFVGSGTAMDWSNTVCQAHLAHSQGGGWLITNIVGNTVTLSSPTSQTVASHSGTIKPARWYVANVSGGYKLFTPNDTWLYSQQVVQATNEAIVKYSSDFCTAAKFEYIDWNFINFNSTGQSNARGDFYDSGACPSNNRIPFMQEQFYSQYCTNNLTGGTWAGLDQAVKDMHYAVSSNYVTQGTNRGAVDYFDPRWTTFLNGFPQNFNNSVVVFAKSAFLMGIAVDDTGISGSPTNAGWNFHTLPDAHNDSHSSFIAMAASPLQTYAGQGLYLNNATNSFKHVFPDPKVYSKLSIATQIYGTSTTGTPPFVCTGAQGPCSLQDFLCGSTGSRYATIGALNTAWGTSYTTCGSSQSIFTGEAVGTGNGTNLTFSHTLANINASKNSIQILVNGTVVGGDCPSGQKGCTVAAGKGDIAGVTLSGGSITYASGVMTVTFTAGNAPAAAAAITVNYTTGGWGAGGTGLMDEDGTHLGANGVCPFLPPAFQANHTYTIGDQITAPSNASWHVVTVGGLSAGSAPTFSSVAGSTVTSGAVTFMSVGLPVCGPGSAHTGALPNATMGADLDEWLGSYTQAYMQPVRTALKTTFPDILYWGPDQLGVALAPANKWAMISAGFYSDIAMTSLWETSQDPVALAKFLYFTRYYPGALSNYQSPVCTQSASVAGGNVPVFSTQQARGQWWYNMNNYWLTQTGFDGLTHGAAIQWTSNIDGIQGNSAFGFKDALYNLWDGHEDTSATVPCSGPLSALNCGGQAVASYNLADGITAAGCGNCIASGNALWFTAAAAPLPPTNLVAIPFTIGQ